MLAADLSAIRTHARKTARPAQSAKLSPREREIIGYRVLGVAFKDIAHSLGLSIHTVKHHTTSAFNKLGVQTSLQAALRFRAEEAK